VGGCGLDLFGSEQGPATCCSEHGDETLGCRKGRHQQELCCMVLVVSNDFGDGSESVSYSVQ
jgi:hypothetical protein